MKMALPKMAMEAAFVVLLFCSAVSCLPTSQNADESTAHRVKRDSQLDQFQRRLVVDNNKGAMRTKIEDSYVLGGMHNSQTTMQIGASPVIMAVRAARNEELPKVELDTPVAAPPAAVMVVQDGTQLAEDDDAGREQGGRAENDDYPVYDAEDYDGDDGAGSNPLVGRSIAILGLNQRQDGARADQMASSDISEQLKQMLLAKLKEESEKTSSENQQRQQGGRDLFNADYASSAEDSWRSARRQESRPLVITLPLNSMSGLLGRSLNRGDNSGELQQQLLSQLLRGARRLSETRFMSATRTGAGDSSNEVLSSIRLGRARTRSSSAEVTKSSLTSSNARGSSSAEQSRGGRELSSNAGGIPKELFVISPVDGEDKPGGFELKKISVS